MPITWYVNLDADPRNHRGPEIPVKVTRSIVTSYDAARSVTWTCTPAATNLNTVAADASWMHGTAPDTQISDVSEEAQTRDFHNRLQIPPYGDESYTVSAQRSDKAGVSLTQQFDVRRRIYYVGNWMNDEGKQLFAIVEPIIRRIFAEVGVELKKVGSASIPNHAVVTDLVPLVTGRPALPQAKVGLMMRLALIQQAFAERAQETVLPLVDQFGVGVGVNPDTVVDDNGVWELTVHLPPEVGIPAHRQLRLAPVPRVTVGIDAYWKYGRDVRRDWFDTMQSLTCDVTRVDDRTARIRIRDTALRPNNLNLTRLATEHRQAMINGVYPPAYFESPPTTAELQLKIVLQGLRPLGGFSSGPNIALTQDMAIYYPAGTRQQKGQALARVFAHEIAHSFGMVMSAYTYNAAAQNHPNWYDGTNGGQGTHCHVNAGLVNNTVLLAGNYYYPDNPNCVQVYTPNNANICIMFHQRSAHLDTLEFCADCQEFMRAQDLSRTHLSAIRHWENLY